MGFRVLSLDYLGTALGTPNCASSSSASCKDFVGSFAHGMWEQRVRVSFEGFSGMFADPCRVLIIGLGFRV